MKSNDGKISISTRKNKKSEVIQLRRLPIKIYGDKKVSTGDQPNEYNFEKYKQGGLKEWERLTLKTDLLTFEEFTKEAMQVIYADVSRTTKIDYENKLNDYIFPRFGKMLIEEIDSDMVEIWQGKVKAEKTSDFARRAKDLLKRILTKAVNKGHLKVNVVQGTKTIKRDDAQQREIYSKEEITLMLDASEGWLKVFILLRVYLGLRSNEMVGLMWKDIDFLRSTAKIERTIRWGRFSTPKGGKRIVGIPKTALDALLEHKQHSDCDYVFATARHNSYWSDCSYINRRHFQPLLKTIGIQYKTFYSLRHSYATFSLLAGINIIHVSENMGHNEISTTTDFYMKQVYGVDGTEQTDGIFGS